MRWNAAYGSDSVEVCGDPDGECVALDDADADDGTGEAFFIDFGGERTALIFNGCANFNEERSYSSIMLARSSSLVMDIKVSKSPLGN